MGPLECISTSYNKLGCKSRPESCNCSIFYTSINSRFFLTENEAVFFIMSFLADNTSSILMQTATETAHARRVVIGMDSFSSLDPDTFRRSCTCYVVCQCLNVTSCSESELFAGSQHRLVIPLPYPVLLIRLCLLIQCTTFRSLKVLYRNLPKRVDS
ncbi:hypothetical protein GCK32_013482 [Trichostrongylus colubriformis]|uniref:Uncharacterized protein n=1 Tax=Trichostrongylus colubriformis TaxID=6319 RepID=A0AAN8IVD2_TRICO